MKRKIWISWHPEIEAPNTGGDFFVEVDFPDGLIEGAGRDEPEKLREECLQAMGQELMSILEADSFHTEADIRHWEKEAEKL